MIGMKGIRSLPAIHDCGTFAGMAHGPEYRQAYFRRRRCRLDVALEIHEAFVSGFSACFVGTIRDGVILRVPIDQRRWEFWR
jgi:hypothetical protein